MGFLHSKRQNQLYVSKKNLLSNSLIFILNILILLKYKKVLEIS